MGGYSLLVVQAISRLRVVFQMELPLRCMFEFPTVSALTTAILQTSDQQAKLEKVAKLWLRVARLSENEVRILLEQKQQKRMNLS